MLYGTLCSELTCENFYKDNAEAVLRNRNAITETKKQGMLVVQAFQNSAAALAAAAAL